jgi:anti-sigma B factor antagonist
VHGSATEEADDASLQANGYSDDVLLPQPAAYLYIATQTYGSTSIVTMAGECDLAVADQLAYALDRVLEQHPRIVVLDLSAVTFIDCAGVRGVLAAQRHVEAHAAHLSIIPACESVHRVFALAGVAAALPFVSEGAAGR